MTKLSLNKSVLIGIWLALTISLVAALYFGLVTSRRRSDMIIWTTGILMAYGTVFAAYGAISTAQSALTTIDEQTRQARVTLWRSLSEEWDHKMQRARVACIKAPPSKLADRYSRIMNFFETLGYLVKHNEIPEAFALHSFSYYFWGYCKYTNRHISADNEKDKTIWENVFWLKTKWKVYEMTKEQYAEFYDDETNLLDRDV